MYIFRNGYFFEDALCDGRVDEIDQQLLLVAELIENFTDKFLGRPTRVGQQGDFGLGRIQVLDQRARDGSLAASRIPGKQRRTAIILQRII